MALAATRTAIGTHARRIRAFWRRIEPGLTINRDSFIERWDAAGEGPATAISFEGFGLSLSFFFARTPAFQPYKQDERSAELKRWYNGEGR
jgi:hypothetical protein